MRSALTSASDTRPSARRRILPCLICRERVECDRPSAPAARLIVIKSLLIVCPFVWCMGASGAEVYIPIASGGRAPGRPAYISARKRTRNQRLRPAPRRGGVLIRGNPFLALSFRQHRRREIAGTPAMTPSLVFLFASLSLALIVVVVADGLRDHRQIRRRLNAIPHYTLNPAALRYIGMCLRDQYDDPASPIPPHLIALVQQLKTGQ
jgi:hypothetical protein